MQKNQNGFTKLSVLLAVIAIIIIIALGACFILHSNETPKTPISQGQTPPVNPQSTGDETADWQTVINAQFGFGLKYPADFFDSGHEPKILTGDCNYSVFPDSCPNINDIVMADQVAAGGDVNAIKSNLSNPNYWKSTNGEKLTINDVPYCLYQTSDAGMGHVYNSYYYATVTNKQCLIVNLNTETTNCDFYLPIEKGNTDQQTNYNNCLITNANQPTTLSQILSTFKFNK